MAECPECGFKVKATPGKLTICPECETKFRAPAEDAREARKPLAKKSVKKEPVKAAAKPEPEITDDMYGFTKDEEDLAAVRVKREEEEKQKAAEKKKSNKPVIEVKRKNIGDLEVWRRIDLAMKWLLAGVCVWGVSHFLFGLVLFLGMIQGPEYAGPVVGRLIRPDQPPIELGAGDALDRSGFVVAMLGGLDLYGLSLGVLIAAQVLFWIQIALWMAGYGIAFPSAPPDNGGKGQLIALFILGALNFLFAFFFIFLPMVGAYPYCVMPWMGSEIAMAEYNMERSMPLHLFWAYSPFWEMILTLILMTLRLGEPIMIAYFTWTVGYAIKDEALEAAALGAVRMGCSVLFILLAYQLFAIAGTSPVMVKVLRVIYLMYFVSIIVWQLRLAGMIWKCRDTFHFYFHPDQD